MLVRHEKPTGPLLYEVPRAAAALAQTSQNGVPDCAACFMLCTWGEAGDLMIDLVASPGFALSASCGSFGASGDEPDPLCAAPPLLIRTGVPEIVTPAGPTTTNPPPA